MRLDFADILIWRLSQIEEVQNRIGNRIRPETGDIGEDVPFITYEMIGSRRVTHLRGISRISVPRYFLECVSPNKKVVQTVITAIDESVIPTIHEDWDNVRVQCVTRNDRFTTYYPPKEGKATGYFGEVLDYTIAFDEE